jgi:hypothetical protein
MTNWDINIFGRNQVKVWLIEASGLGDWKSTWDWEAHNRLLSQLPFGEDRNDNKVFSDALRIFGQHRLFLMLKDEKLRYQNIVKESKKKLESIDVLLEDKLSIKNEIVVLVDRINYIEECLSKLID